MPGRPALFRLYCRTGVVEGNVIAYLLLEHGLRVWSTPPQPAQPGIKPGRKLFLGRIVGPIEWFSETVITILVLLSFTLMYTIFEPPPNPDQPPSAQYAMGLVIGILEAILAWALIDAVMKVLLAVFERSEKHRLLNSVQSAGTQDEGIEAVAEELDEILEPITAEENRRSLYQDVVEHLRGSRPQPVRVTLEDVTHALGVFFAAVFAVLPPLVPIILLRNNFELGIRASNLVSFIVLFYAGYQWGKYTDVGAWKTGFLMFMIGAVLVIIAILIDG